MEHLFEYKGELDELRFSEEEKAAMIRRLAAEPAADRKPRRLWRTVLIAAAVTAVLVVGAGASGVLKSAVEVFAPLFGRDVAQTAVIDKIGRPIGASDTDNGVTITADAIMGDRYNAVIVYTISRDDGTALLPEGVEANELLMGNFGGASLDAMGGSHGSSRFVDEIPGDNAIQLVQSISADYPLSGCTATAEFRDLCRWDETAEKPEMLVEGHWKFRFDAVYEDASITLGGGETFTQDGLTFTVDQITLSPVAIKVDYTVDSEVKWSNAPSGREDPADSLQMQRYLGNVAIALTKTDGTEVTLDRCGGSLKPERGVTVCDKGGVFDTILPLEEIESVSVGGIVYKVARA